jgi:CubicO group peptidase (beta-lactamase class C family)
MGLESELAGLVEQTAFSGAVVVSHRGERRVGLAAGLAHRALQLPNTLDTRFAIASATKGLTALAVASVIESGQLSLDTPLRSLVPDRLHLVDEQVTIEHLLAHTSGVGDYIDESSVSHIDDYLFELSPHVLDTPAAYLRLVETCPQRSTPGAQFAYNNSGYVILSIALEAATGESFYDLIRDRVLMPAGMHDTEFLRSDHLPPATALGYLGSGRTNVFHLPVRGAGDGGVYSTVADLERLWSALLAGRIVSLPMVEAMLTVRHQLPGGRAAYGWGFWLHPSGQIAELHGYDAGVACRTIYDRTSGWSYVVVSNDSTGAGPIAAHLDQWCSSPTG